LFSPDYHLILLCRHATVYSIQFFLVICFCYHSLGFFKSLYSSFFSELYFAIPDHFQNPHLKYFMGESFLDF